MKVAVPGSRPSSAWGHVGALLAIFAATFLYHYLTLTFPNDHFVHLSRAQQILSGELPGRDFFDPGMILQYYVSVAGLALSGHTIFGEVIITSLFLALGATLTYWLSARLAGSSLVGVAAVTLTLVLLPRPYSYPKAFLYVLALAGGWAYAHGPSVRRLAGLGVITVTAFLFRHDHGVYIGLFSVALLLGVDWREPRRGLMAVGRYVAVVTLCLLPYVVFIQTTMGLPAYVREVWGPGHRVMTVRLNFLPFDIDLSAPLLTVTPPADRRVNVRWAENVDEADRQARAAAYGLSSSALVEGTTWSYVPTDTGAATLGGLVADPTVEDTSGIDRQTMTLADERLWARMQRQIGLLRTQLLPGVATGPNALAWLYYVFLLVPVASAACLVVTVRRGVIGHAEAAWVAAATLLLTVTLQTIVRGSPDSRLPDVAGLVCVMAAWTAGRWVSGGAPGWTAVRAMKGAAVAAGWLSLAWAAALFGDLPGQMEKLGVFGGPRGVLERLSESGRRGELQRIDTWHYDPGLGALARYAQECTTPTDRLFVTWFAPEVFFFAERPFAGGQVYLHPGWHASPDDQRLTVDRLRGQRVPIVLSLADDSAFARGFPLVYDYVMRNYRFVAEATFGGELRYAVRVDPQIVPTRTEERLGLPCFR